MVESLFYIMRAFLRKYLPLLLGLFGFLLPLSLAVAEVLLPVLVLCWLLSVDFRAAYERLRQPIPLIFAVFFLLHLTALCYTEDLSLAWLELKMKYGLLFFPLLLFSIPSFSEKVFKRILYSFASGCLLTGGICFIGSLINYYEIGAVSYLHYSWLSNIMGFHPAYLCLYMSFTFFILLNGLFEDWKKHSISIRLLGIVLLLFTAYMVVMLSARLVVMTFLVLLCISFLVWLARKKQLFVGLVIVLLGAIAFQQVMSHFFITRTRANKIFESKARNQYPHNFFIPFNDPRGQIWEAGFATIPKMPVWGYGIGDDVQNVLYEMYDKKSYPHLRKIKANAHSQYLQTFLAIGLPGLFFLLLMLLHPLLLSWRGKLYLHTCFLLLFLIPMLTETLLETAHGLLFFAFFSGLLARRASSS